MCVRSLLCGPWADLWQFYGFLCKRFSFYSCFYIEVYRLRKTAIYQGRNMVYGLRAQSPKYDWDQGSSEEGHHGSQCVSLITIFFRIIRFLSIEFPGRSTLPILASGWRQFLLYEVLVVWRKHGIIFVTYLIVEGTVIWISSHFSRFVTQLLNALSTPEGRESDLYSHIFFCEKCRRRERTKRNPVTEKGT